MGPLDGGDSSSLAVGQTARKVLLPSVSVVLPGSG